MIITKKAAGLKNALERHRKNNKKIGFVPTMGALHQGHLSLIEKSQTENDITVCSIFVNPTQFNEADDFKKYPRTVTSDINLLEKSNTDLLFLPEVVEVYPKGTESDPVYDFEYLETVMEGAHRPGHFKGVAQVVARLLEIVQPDKLYLGQKDYQQCLILQKLINEILKWDIQIKVCPIIREDNGLAMSSRNARLSTDERAKAGAISQTLLFIKEQAGKKPLFQVKKEAMEKLKSVDIIGEVEYLEIADADTLKDVKEWDDSQNLIACVAVRVGDIRLIDNMFISRD